MDWLRSKEYIDYFETLDRKGGFYYERWGDAPIHSIAAGLFLKKEQLQFWDEIAYFHMPYTHCPHDEQLRMDLRCSCDPGGNFDWRDGSCEFSLSSVSRHLWLMFLYTGLPRYYLANGIPLPDGVNTYGWLSTLGMIILLAGFIGLLIIAINPRARNHALLGGQHLYRQSQTFWERYQKERLEWEIERLARTRSNS